MSVQAITWALEEAPDVPPQLVSTLIALANHAGRDGHAAYPSTETLTAYTRKSYRQVRRDLDDLAAVGLIRPGDPACVAHIRADRRPQIWDLAVERKRPRGDTDDHPKCDGGTSMSPREAERGDMGDLPQSGDGGSPMTERGDMGDRHGGSWVTPEPSLEPSMNQLPDSLRSSGARDGTTTSPRGTRLPDDFTVTPDMVRWARDNTPDVDGRHETAKFCDYWSSKAGAAARKTDWVKTWRNWMRKAQDDIPQRRNGNTYPHRVPTTTQRVTSIQSLKRGEAS